MKNRIILLLLGNHGLTGCNVIGSIAHTDIDFNGQGIEIVTKAEQLRYPAVERHIPFEIKAPVCATTFFVGEDKYEKQQTRMRNNYSKRSRWK